MWREHVFGATDPHHPRDLRGTVQSGGRAWVRVRVGVKGVHGSSGCHFDELYDAVLGAKQAEEKEVDDLPPVRHAVSPTKRRARAAGQIVAARGGGSGVVHLGVHHEGEEDGDARDEVDQAPHREEVIAAVLGRVQVDPPLPRGVRVRETVMRMG